MNDSFQAQTTDDTAELQKLRRRNSSKRSCTAKPRGLRFPRNT